MAGDSSESNDSDAGGMSSFIGIAKLWVVIS